MSTEETNIGDTIERALRDLLARMRSTSESERVAFLAWRDDPSKVVDALAAHEVAHAARLEAFAALDATAAALDAIGGTWMQRRRYGAQARIVRRDLKRGREVHARSATIGLGLRALATGEVI
jgi:hypothetical protein